MSQFFKTKEETQQWLDNAGVQNYTINDDLTIDVDGHVDLSGEYDIQNEQYSSVMIDGKLPVQFGKVTGDFDVFEAGLTTLKGSPSEVGGDYRIACNELSSLEYSPERLNGKLAMYDNNITSFEHAPKYVEGSMYAHRNKLESLENMPDVQGDIRTDFSEQQVNDYVKQNNIGNVISDWQKQRNKDMAVAKAKNSLFNSI